MSDRILTRDQPNDGSEVHSSGIDRRDFLLGLPAVGALALPTYAEAAAAISSPDDDYRLSELIQTVVVIYSENRSFNNLFANFPGVERPLSKLVPGESLQRDRDGKVLDKLPPIWGGLVPQVQSVNHQLYQIGEASLPDFPNAPFALRTPSDEMLPTGLITRDLVHTFYNNQLQINGGRNDGFVAWGDSGALPMGFYGDGAVNLRLWSLAREFTLCDNFFMGAFGGSFLNHQYLIAAQPPYYPRADKSPAHNLIVELDAADPRGIRPRQRSGSPVSAMEGPIEFVADHLTPDFWAVNTMGPPYWPAFSRSASNADYADPKIAITLPPQQHRTIGDAMSTKGVRWAWYAGGWAFACRGERNEGDVAPRPNFRPHHQPFNYFSAFAPGTSAREAHLRDAGVGNSADTNLFMRDIEEGRLPQVAFYKPQGDLNMHAGNSDVDAGDHHIASIVHTLRNGPQWERMMVIVTFDENGGWWDHVAPPVGDRWGPGSRIPALIISPHARKGQVDHSIYDTGSIARFLIRRFGLENLPGLRAREKAMLAHGGVVPGDLTNALII